MHRSLHDVTQFILNSSLADADAQLAELNFQLEMAQAEVDRIMAERRAFTALRSRAIVLGARH